MVEVIISPNEYPQEKGSLDLLKLRKLLNKDNPLILEVGANVGSSTLEFLQVFPEARVYCFEPEPRAIALFKQYVQSNNVTLVETAIGQHNGNITFHQSDGVAELKDWHMSGSIRAPKTVTDIWPSLRFEKQIEVPIMRLDDWAALSGVEAVDFIWADVQGAEGDLIAGATNVLGNTKYFYTEYGTSEWYEGQAPLGEICNSLFDLGHVMLQKFGIDALFVNKNLVDISTLRFPIKQQSPCPCGSGKIYKKCHG